MTYALSLFSHRVSKLFLATFIERHLQFMFAFSYLEKLHDFIHPLTHSFNIFMLTRAFTINCSIYYHYYVIIIVELV